MVEVTILPCDATSVASGKKEKKKKKTTKGGGGGGGDRGPFLLTPEITRWQE